MKYFLLFIIIVTGLFTANSQITLFEDSFETYDNFTIENFGDWVMYDLDGTPTWGVPECNFVNEGYTGAGIVFNPYECTEDQMGPFNPEAGNYSILTGEKYVSFWCAVETTNDNYLVSPIIDLSDVTEPVLTFFAKSLANANNGFDPERFEVLLSITGNEVNDFTINLGDVNEISTCCNWNEYTYDLTDYIDEEVYIAIHHISSENTYALHIDDFKVEAASSTADVHDFATLSFSCYPNPFQEQINLNSHLIIKEVSILNILGQETLHDYPLSKEMTVNTIDLETGIYILKVKTAIGMETIKIVKK